MLLHSEAQITHASATVDLLANSRDVGFCCQEILMAKPLVVHIIRAMAALATPVHPHHEALHSLRTFPVIRQSGLGQSKGGEEEERTGRGKPGHHKI